MTKVAAVYEQPFWRGQGLTGQAVALSGLVSITFDDSPPDGSQGVIIGFVGGNNARSYDTMTTSARQSAVLAQFAQLEGVDSVVPISHSYKLVSRQARAERTVVRVRDGVSFGGEQLAIAGGPWGADRADPLGGDGDLDLLERVYGRGGEIRRARGSGSAGLPVSRQRASLCDYCRHQQLVPNTRGSVFSLCRRSRTEPERFPRYPRLPVVECPGYEESEVLTAPEAD